MNTRLRPGLVASGAVLLATGLVTGVLFASAALAAVAINDPVADTVIDGSSDPLPEARADVVSASADYGAKAITLGVRPRQPNEPLRDSNWMSDFTFVQWELDVTGDRRPEYLVRYYVDEGRHSGDVLRATDEESVCDATAASYDPVTGFSVQIEPNCVSTPASFFYTAAIYYDTRVADDNAPAASDIVPDRGFAGPVTMTGAVPATPAAPASAAPAVRPPAPKAAAPTPTRAAAPTPQRAQTGRVVPSAQAARPAPGAASTAQSAPAPRPAPAGPSRPRPGAAVTAPAPAHDPVSSAALTRPQLARTGPRTTMLLAGMATALVLAGLGLLILARGFVPVPVRVQVADDRSPAS